MQDIGNKNWWNLVLCKQLDNLLNSNNVVELSEKFKQACLIGDLDAVQLLIRQGVKNVDEGLLAACYGNHCSVIDQLLIYGVSNVYYAFLFSCKNGKLESVKKLLLSRCALSGLQEAFYLASSGGHLETVIELAKHSNTEWNTAFEGACTNSHLDVIFYIIQKSSQTLRWRNLSYIRDTHKQGILCKWLFHYFCADTDSVFSNSSYLSGIDMLPVFCLKEFVMLLDWDSAELKSDFVQKLMKVNYGYFRPLMADRHTQQKCIVKSFQPMDIARIIARYI